MRKLINVLINSLLLVSTIALSNVAKTLGKAPDSTHTTAQSLAINSGQVREPPKQTEEKDVNRHDPKPQRDRHSLFGSICPIAN